MIIIEDNVQPVVRQITQGDDLTYVVSKDGHIRTVLEDKKKFPYKIRRKLNFCVHLKDGWHRITIPAGYVWNGADIIKTLWLIVGTQFNPEFLLASLLHDFMLENREPIMNVTFKGILKPQEYRAVTSNVFYYGLIHSGVSEKKANLMRFFVDKFQMLFGGF